MKNLSIFLLAILLINCSDKKDDVQLNSACGDRTIIKELTETIPAIVKHVKDGEPFYMGSKIYYEIDAETYLPEVFGQNNIKHIRVFPINKINREIDSQIMVKGTITSCLTGDHGLLTNDYIGFYLLEQ